MLSLFCLLDILQVMPMGDTILSSMEKQFARYGLDLASWSVFLCALMSSVLLEDPFRM